MKNKTKQKKSYSENEFVFNVGFNFFIGSAIHRRKFVEQKSLEH